MSIQDNPALSGGNQPRFRFVASPSPILRCIKIRDRNIAICAMGIERVWHKRTIEYVRYRQWDGSWDNLPF